MPWPRSTLASLGRLTTSREILRDTFIGREEVVDALVLATLAHEHVLLVGPPGTAELSPRRAGASVGCAAR